MSDPAPPFSPEALAQLHAALALHEDAISQLRDELAQRGRPAEIVLGTVGQQVVTRLDRLAEGVELLCQVLAVDKSDAWSMVTRRLEKRAKEKP